MQRWDVILVGAGFGGLCTGALLARAGKRVLVLDKEGTIGGRAKTVLHAGHVLDDGAHIPSRAGHLEGIFLDLGLRFPDVFPLEKSEIYHENRWKSPRELFTGEMFKKVLAEMQRLTSEDLASLDDTPLRDWVERMSGEPGIQMLFFYLGCATSVGNRFEIYLFSQPAVVRSLHCSAGWDPEEVSRLLEPTFRPHFTPLDNSATFFTWPALL